MSGLFCNERKRMPLSAITCKHGVEIVSDGDVLETQTSFPYAVMCTCCHNVIPYVESMNTLSVTLCRACVGPVKMTNEQLEHLANIKIKINGLVDDKYRRGAAEHAGTDPLMSMGLTNLTDNVISELLDGLIYCLEVKRKLEMLDKLLMNSGLNKMLK